MQRTALLFGLAASTLIAALLLVPRTNEVPAAPSQPEAPPSKGPITQLVYGDGTLEVQATLDRGLVQPGSTEPVWMDVAIKATGVHTRAPLAAVLVVDRSGSMAGDKIDAARLAAERFVLGLTDGDMVSVVSYGSDVTVDLPMTRVDERGRQAALAVVRNLSEGGGTNIDGGLMAAKRELARTELSGRVARVIVLSDGRPTEGDRRTSTLVAHSEALRALGATSSTVGLGLDYNEDLMEQLAVVGGGRYHYLKTGDEMGRILDAELHHGRNVVASRVTLHLDRALAPGLSILEVPGQLDRGAGHKVQIDLGDLAAGEERHVLVKVAVDAAAVVADGVGFAAPELVYRQAGTQADSLVAHRADAFRLLPSTDLAAVNESRIDAVRIRALQVEASVALTTSMQAWSSGERDKAKADLDRARVEVKAAAARTGNAVLLREAKNLDAVYESVAAAPVPSSAEGQDLVKAQKAHAFGLRR
jgi:Ca-activated chloride channel family protein